MSAAKFTPGPWDFRDGYGQLKAEVVASGRAIATVWIRELVNMPEERAAQPTAWPEGEANASLIAAAPELLEALKLARDYINAELLHRQEAYAGYPHKWATEQEDLATVDAVIARATGASHD